MPHASPHADWQSRACAHRSHRLDNCQQRRRPSIPKEGTQWCEYSAHRSAARDAGWVHATRDQGRSVMQPAENGRWNAEQRAPVQCRKLSHAGQARSPVLRIFEPGGSHAALVVPRRRARGSRDRASPGQLRGRGSSLTPGARIRVMNEETTQSLSGTFLSLRNTMLRLEVTEAGPVEVPLRFLSKLEISRAGVPARAMWGSGSGRERSRPLSRSGSPNWAATTTRLLRRGPLTFAPPAALAAPCASGW